MLGNTNASSFQASMNNLSISINGTNKLTYNGKDTKSLDITLSALGAAASNHNHGYITSDNSAKDLMYGAARLYLIQESSNYGGVTSWKNILKVPHSNSEGYFTEWAINFTGDNAAYYRTMRSGVDSGFVKLVDANNLSDMAANLTVAKAKNADYATSAGTASNSNTVGGFTPGSFLFADLTDIEMNKTGALKGYGGFIDFHFNGSTADYTSRIIEGSSGCLSINKMNIYNSHSCKSTVIQSSTPPTDTLWAW